MQRFFVLIILVYLNCVIGAGITLAKDLSASGIYSLIKVNGKSLPAISWSRKVDGKPCNEEVLEGAMFLDSVGGMSVFVSTREVCLSKDGLEAVIKEASTIFPGEYKSAGRLITINLSDDKMTFMAFSNKVDMNFDQFSDPSHADLKGNILILKEEGIGDYQGQVSEFVFKKID